MYLSFVFTSFTMIERGLEFVPVQINFLCVTWSPAWSLLIRRDSAPSADRLVWPDEVVARRSSSGRSQNLFLLP